MTLADAARSKLVGLSRAAREEPRVFRAEISAAYVREARVWCESLLSYLRLAAKAFDALPGQKVSSSAGVFGRSEGDGAAQPLMGLILEEEEDPTCSSLLEPLAGPLAVFFVDVGTTLSAAADDAQLTNAQSSAPCR